ncbi:MAG: helix-turn-helix domain-containing protein, partial [Streptococcus hyovaginalis]|nr:helix-turn-helix domain-containing protein [Streptococcus hyovaginalis]
PTEAKILRILMTHDQQVIAKEDFLEKLWQDDSFIDHNTLSVNITRLRKKLKTIGFNHLHTARGVGYFLK